MIDEYFEKKLDEFSKWAPKHIGPRMTRMANSSPGWRVYLYSAWVAGGVRNALSQIRTEEEVNTLFEEMEERVDQRLRGVKGALKRGGGVLCVADEFCLRQRFGTSLALMLMCVLGVCALGTRQMVVLALALCLLWLSTALDCGYTPVCGAIRQRFLMGMLLRITSVSLIIINEFEGYLRQGVHTNIVLQCAMVAALIVHAVFTLGLVAFNTRQPILLRAVAAVGGCAPALAAAAAVAHAASLFARPWPLPLAGVLGAIGAVLAFLGEELVGIHNLGAIRLKYYSLWSYLMTMGGFLLLIVGAWIMGA